jgi:hypothetical protein
MAVPNFFMVAMTEEKIFMVHRILTKFRVPAAEFWSDHDVESITPRIESGLVKLDGVLS